MKLLHLDAPENEILPLIWITCERIWTISLINSSANQQFLDLSLLKDLIYYVKRNRTQRLCLSSIIFFCSLCDLILELNCLRQIPAEDQV